MQRFGAMKLKDLAEIQIGYQFRSRVDTVSDGNYRVVQIKDIDSVGKRSTKDLSRIMMKRPVEKYLIDEGDVLFLARGHRNFAIPILDDLHDVIAPGYFFILRPRQELVHPGFLAWYINQSPAQTFIQRIARTGTHMPVVTKTSLEILQIPVPPLDHQHTIVRAAELLDEEVALLERLIQKRKLLVESICLKATRSL